MGLRKIIECFTRPINLKEKASVDLKTMRENKYFDKNSHQKFETLGESNHAGISDSMTSNSTFWHFGNSSTASSSYFPSKSISSTDSSTMYMFWRYSSNNK